MAKQKDGGGTSTFVFGTLIGMVTGGIAALWMSPRSGEETRDQLRQRFRFVVDRVQGESVEDSIEMGKSIAHQKRAESARQANDTSGG